ncbi:MAG: zinc-ribbon domain-containing protein [Coprothermobacterota bacterium]|nr:zinc-ribbon domain-containing protein [Coprothermobacterota bacterium]
MPYCPNCGKEHDANERFCQTCGLNFGVQQMVQPSQTLVTYQSIQPTPTVQQAQPVGVVPSNGTATAGFVCGLVAIILVWIPWVSLIAIILGVIGLILSGLGLSQANKMAGSGRGMAIAGLVLSIIVVLIFVTALAIGAAIIGQFFF